MAWPTEMTVILRHLINDLGTGSSPGEPTVFTYDDTRLTALLLVAAQLTQQDVTFGQTYTINISELLLSPDPTLPPTRDDAFINLSILKAACIIDNSEARYAAKRAVLMRDNNFTVDNRGAAEAVLQIWQKGWCEHYANARYEFMAGNVGSAGGAIIGPFRVYAGYYGGPWTPDGNYAGSILYGNGMDTLNDGRYR